MFTVASLFLSACSSSTTSTPAAPAQSSGSASQPAPSAPQSGPQKGGILKINEVAPGGVIGVPWEMVMGIVAAIPAIEPLLWMDATGNVSPKLAEKWELAADKKSMTLNLRKGVKFHDGTDFNAEAAKWNIDQHINAKRITNISSVDAVDPYTIKLNFPNYDNRMLLTLSGTPSTMISPTWFKANGIEKARVQPVGTGPFQFVSYERDAKTVYKKFPDYWDKGKPHLDGVEITAVTDAQTAKAALISGQIDVWAPGPEITSELKTKGGYTLMSNTSGIMMLWPDSANSDSPMAKKEVREALSYAIDRDAFVKARGFGLVTPLNQPSFPNLNSYIKDYKGPSYDPVKAKELLAKAGYPNGFKTKLIGAAFMDMDTMVAIQGFLKTVGIEAEVEIPQQAKYTEYQTKGWKGILVQPWGYFANYVSIIGFYFWGGEVFISTKRPDNFQAMFDDARITQNPEPDKTQKLNQALINDMTVIPMWQSPRIYVSNPKVQGTTHMQWNSWPWWTPADAWIKK